MRSVHAVSSLLRPGPGRRTATCGRCGDSFSGAGADSRTWLAAHVAAEHAPLRQPVLRTA